MLGIQVRRRTRWVAALGSCLVIMGSSAGASADEVSQEHAASLKASQDAAVRTYAEDYGVSATEARQVLEEQAKGKDLGMVLPRELGKSFAQVTFTGGRFNVYVQEGGDVDHAHQLLTERGISATATVHEVSWNATDLMDGLRSAHDALAARMSTRRFRVTAVNGALEISLAPSAEETAERLVASTALTTESEQNIPVKLVRANSEFGEPTPAYTLPGYGGPPWVAGMLNKPAGDRAGPCTTGFHARALGNYFLTAGHCLFNGGTPYRQICTSSANCFTAGVDVGGYVNWMGDAGVIASWDVMGPYPAMLDWNQRYVGVGVFGYSTSIYDFFYCHTGIGSHQHGHSATTCGRNKGTTIANYDPFPDGSRMVVQTLRGNVCSYAGDSGGPIWDPYVGYAIGILTGADWTRASGPFGGCGTNMIVYYTDAVPAARALGVTIATL
ncbi:MAG: hypothetical protein WBD40_09060 [Tepidisphaeraceae bacterium]